MRSRFDRSEEFNKHENVSVIQEMKLLSNKEEEREYEYDSDETALLEEGEEEMKKGDNYDDVPSLYSMSNLASLATDSLGKWMMVTTEVRGGAEQVLAHLWHFEGREMRTASDVRREVVIAGDDDSHHRRQFVKLVSMSSEKQRVEFMNTMVWRKNVNGSYLLVSSPTTKIEGNNRIRRNSLHDVLPALEKVAMKANLRSYYHIETTSTNKCQMRHVFHLDLGSDKKSRKLAKKLSRKQEYLLPLATRVQEHFQSLRHNTSSLIVDNRSFSSTGREIRISLDDADGIALGEALMMTLKRTRDGGKKKKVVAAAVKQFIREYKAMSELSKEFNWVGNMLEEILKNAKKSRKVERIESRLDSLESEEARHIGAALIAIVAKSINEHVGVKEWIEKYPSMKELSTRHSFVARLMEVIVTQTVREVNWMMLLEAAANTFVSVFDLLTDLYMIYFYFSTDQAGFAIATSVMIMLGLIAQMVVITIHYQDDKKARNRELLNVLTFTKGKSTLSLTSSIFSIIVLTLHSFHPTLSGGRIQLQVLKGDDTQGCSLESPMEMVNFEVQEVRNFIDNDSQPLSNLPLNFILTLSSFSHVLQSILLLFALA
jgi:hypothetical protein